MARFRLGLLQRREMPAVGNDHKFGARNLPGDFTRQCRPRQRVLTADNDEGWARRQHGAAVDPPHESGMLADECLDPSVDGHLPDQAVNAASPSRSLWMRTVISPS
jgi:hypothetical protein